MGTRDAAAPRSPKGTASPPSRTARGGPETPQNLPAYSFAAHVPASGHSAQPRHRTAGRLDAAALRSIRARQGVHPHTAANTRRPPPRRRAGRQGAPCRSFPSEQPSPRRAMHSPFSSRRPPTPILPQARARGKPPQSVRPTMPTRTGTHRMPPFPQSPLPAPRTDPFPARKRHHQRLRPAPGPLNATGRTPAQSAGPYLRSSSSKRSFIPNPPP